MSTEDLAFIGRVCPEGYTYHREQVKPRPYSVCLSGVWTDIKGLRFRYAPHHRTDFWSTDRPRVIRCVWLKEPPLDADHAVREGWWPLDVEAPPNCAPHFAIAEDGQIVQYLDPARQGSNVRGMAKGPEDQSFPPRQTIVIANLGRKWSPKLKAQGPQFAALQALVDMVQRIYWHPKVVLEGPWEKVAQGE